nr:efflux RND transporter permease subunit [Polynucleobacter necessarius]
MIGTVKHTLFFGISLVLAVLFFFLGNIRAAAVVAAVIPLALCVSFIQMHLWCTPLASSSWLTRPCSFWVALKASSLNRRHLQWALL